MLLGYDTQKPIAEKNKTMPAFNKLLFIILVFAVLTTSPPAKAAEPSVDEPIAPDSEDIVLFQEISSVYGASKYKQKITEAPSSVSIVTDDDIKKYGYRTLADILNSVRSFYLTYDRKYTYVGVRGFGRPSDYNSRIQILIDGHRTNDAIYNSAAIGTDFMLDVDLIDQVEIIRGPGSSLYGSNAVFAVVNIITRRGKTLKIGELSGEAGSHDTYKSRVTYGSRYQNGLEIIASGSFYTSRRQRLYFSEFDPANPLADPRAANGGYSSNTDYDRSRSFFSKIAFQDFTLSGAYSSRTKGIPTGAFSTDFSDPGNKTTDDYAYLDLRYERVLGPRTDITARLYYDYYEYNGNYISAGVQNKDQAYSQSWGGEMKLNSRFLDNHRIIAGAEYTGNVQQNQMTYDVNPYYLWLDDRRSSRVLAAYLQDEFIIAKNLLTLNAGVRYDNYSTFGDTINPRLALLYTPLPKSIVKLLFGTAFRAPTPFELYYASATNVPNPELKPEKMQTCELIFEQYLGERFRATVSGFYYNIEDLINQVDDGTGRTYFQNIDKARSFGAEFELENKWENGIEGRINYTIQKATNARTNEVLSNSPEHLAKLNVIIPVVRNKLFAGIEQRYTSKRKTEFGDYTRDFYSTNITVYSRQFLKGLELSASVYNLFDTRYSDPASKDFVQHAIMQDGRSFRLKMTYAF